MSQLPGMCTLHLEPSPLCRDSNKPQVGRTAGTPALPSSAIGLKPNWRSLTHANSTSSSPAPSSTSTPRSTPSLAISQKVAHKRTFSRDVGTGAFTDKDLFEDPTTLSAWRSKIPQQMVSVDGEDSDEIDDLEQPDVKPQILQKHH